MGFPGFQLLAEGDGLSLGLPADDPRCVISTTWLDLTAEPLVLRSPHMQGRHFNITLFDTAGRPFASVGSRSGEDAGVDLAVVGPDWRGELPSGLRALRAPSDSVWVLSRIYAHSTVDHRHTLSLAKRQCVALLHPTVDPPRFGPPYWIPPSTPCPAQVAEMRPPLFFHRLDALLDRAPPALQQSLRPRIQELRDELGGPPPTAEWSSPFEHALENGFADAVATIRAAASTVAAGEAQGWRAMRTAADPSMNATALAACAYANLGAPKREDLLSLVCDRDSSDRPLSGAHCYRVHIARKSLPPVKAFWSLCATTTAPGAEQRGLGDRSDLMLNEDGSLDLLIQHAAPEVGLIRNWVPAPESAFSLVIRLYWVAPAALSGGWRMPPVERYDPRAGANSKRPTPPTRLPRSRGGDELRPINSAWSMSI